MKCGAARFLTVGALQAVEVGRVEGGGMERSSVGVWWVVYAACEMGLVGLHRFPSALVGMLAFYAVVAWVSIPTQWAIQVCALHSLFDMGLL